MANKTTVSGKDKKKVADKLKANEAKATPKPVKKIAVDTTSPVQPKKVTKIPITNKSVAKPIEITRSSTKSKVEAPAPKGPSKSLSRIESIRQNMLMNDRMREITQGDPAPYRNFPQAKPGTPAPEAKAPAKAAVKPDAPKGKGVEYSYKVEGPKAAKGLAANAAEKATVGSAEAAGPSLATRAGYNAIKYGAKGLRLAGKVTGLGAKAALAYSAADVLYDVMDKLPDNVKQGAMESAARRESEGMGRTYDPGINVQAQGSRKPNARDTVSQPQKVTENSFTAPTNVAPQSQNPKGNLTNAPMSRDPSNTQPDYGPNMSGGEQTKGGFYPTYKKDSPEAGDFRTSFAKAAADGVKQFVWQGRVYNTQLKS